MTLHLDIELPRSLSVQEQENLQRHLQEVAIIRLYNQNILSRKEACEALQIKLRAFLKLIQIYGIAEMRDLDAFERDLVFAHS